MKNAFEAAASEFKSTIETAVKKMFPLLVAAELAKLSSGGSTEKPKLKKGSIKIEIMKLHETGMSNADIARQLDTSQPYVSVVVNGKSTKALSKLGTMQEALSLHGSKIAAAKALGIPRQTFSDRLAKELAA